MEHRLLLEEYELEREMELQIERGRPPKEEQLCLATSVKFTIIKVNLTRVCSTSTNSNQTLGLI